jgi:hypothetical protein
MLSPRMCAMASQNNGSSSSTMIMMRKGAILSHVCRSVLAITPEGRGLGWRRLKSFKSEDFHLWLVSNCLPDPYVGDFLARLGSSPQTGLLDCGTGGPVPCHQAAEAEKYDRKREASTKLKPAVFLPASRKRWDQWRAFYLYGT